MQKKAKKISHDHIGCTCFIIPEKVLKKFSHDKDLSDQERKFFADAAKFESEWRKGRDMRTELALTAQKILPSGLQGLPLLPPTITLFDCQQHNTLPGVAISSPQTSADPTCTRAFNYTTAVANFYQTVFGRHSIDDAGMAMISSIHYSVNYNNAFWNGGQMTYGDGDGNIFIDFTKGNDVIAHELTHGVTQYTLGLNYANESGGLNESISDVFGTMFRQWEANQDFTTADWLIGSDIMGPGATLRGFTCLRDMAAPGAKHCLSPQPNHYSKYKPGMDPHESSGIPNFAFYTAAKTLGGNSWLTAGKIWYQAVAGFGTSPNMTMKQFANRTRSVAKSLFTGQKSVISAIDSAWKSVGL
ncbi:M4 family metallopeptidase [Pedobacter sp. MR2016-19]|uniref:M4 family metallopeptidase n=1 Tax=Pedobacter sp. MR2016-19 TaxID=2780089 RepID=UPI00187477C9|nr:M4 family metallopeptidase [Pedobacter sp. MR2016-19]MBE5322283.1 M4 family metallopeptidase [Pedobacter sp. MR2016-19]